MLWAVTTASGLGNLKDSTKYHQIKEANVSNREETEEEKSLNIGIEQ